MALLSSMKGQGWGDIIDNLREQAKDPSITYTTVNIEGLILEGPPAIVLQEVEQSRNMSLSRTLDLICAEFGARIKESGVTKDQLPAFLDNEYARCYTQAQEEAKGKSSAIKKDMDVLMEKLSRRVAVLKTNPGNAVWDYDEDTSGAIKTALGPFATFKSAGYKEGTYQDQQGKIVRVISAPWRVEEVNEEAPVEKIGNPAADDPIAKPKQHLLDYNYWKTLTPLDKDKIIAYRDHLTKRQRELVERGIILEQQSAEAKTLYETLKSEKHAGNDVSFMILPPVTAEQLLQSLHARLAYFSKAYPDCWKNTDHILSKKNQFQRVDNPGWPGWCYMPHQAFDAYNPLNIKDQTSRTACCTEFLTLAAWRQTKNLFRFDTSLLDELWETPLTGKIPTELFETLPDYSVLVMLPEGAFAEASGAQAALCQMTKVSQYRTMSINFIDVTNSMSGVVAFPLLDTLEESFQFVLDSFNSVENRSVDTNIVGAPRTFEEANHFAKTILTACERDLRGLMSMMLYLCSEKPDVESKLGTSLPEKPKPQMVKGTPRFFAAQQPVVWDVGTRIGSLLRSQYGPRPEYLGGHHRSPRPHTRRPHWHTYRVGPGRSGIRLKWIWLTLVGQGELVDTVRPVTRKLKA